MRELRRLSPPLDFRFLDLMLILLAAMGGLLVSAIAWRVVTQESTQLEILNGELSDGLLGRAYLEEVFASGGVKPYRWTAFELPPGLSLSEQGVLAGVPTRAGDTGVHLGVSSADGRSRDGRFTLSILEVAHVTPLRMTTRKLPAAIAGFPYELTIAAVGGVPDYGIEVAKLPDGLRDSGMIIEGTPTGEFVGDLNVTLTDSVGSSVTDTFVLRVLAKPDPLQRQMTSLLRIDSKVPLIVKGRDFEMQLTAMGGSPPYQWQLLQEIPGVRVSTGGVLAIGAAASELPNSIFVRAFDEGGAVAEQELELNVFEPPGMIFRVLVVLALLAAWSLLIAFLWRWALHRPRPVRIRSADLATLLSIAFVLAGVAVHFSGIYAPTIFVAVVISIGLLLYFDHT